MEEITKPLWWSAAESLAKRDDGVIHNLLHMDQLGVVVYGILVKVYIAKGPKAHLFSRMI